MRRVRAAVAITALLALAAPAAAQAPPRLAAPEDCLTNPNCAPGLAAVYGFDVRPVLVPLAVADAGIAALDDGARRGRGRVLHEPAGLTTRHPHARTTIAGSSARTGSCRSRAAALLRAHGPRLRRRLDATSRLITTLALRSLNQQVIDGRLPEAVGGEFVDANGLGVRARPVPACGS